MRCLLKTHEHSRIFCVNNNLLGKPRLARARHILVLFRLCGTFRFDSQYSIYHRSNYKWRNSVVWGGIGHSIWPLTGTRYLLFSQQDSWTLWLRFSWRFRCWLVHVFDTFDALHVYTVSTVVVSYSILGKSVCQFMKDYWKLVRKDVVRVAVVHNQADFGGDLDL